MVKMTPRDLREQHHATLDSIMSNGASCRQHRTSAPLEDMVDTKTSEKYVSYRDDEFSDKANQSYRSN